MVPDLESEPVVLRRGSRHALGIRNVNVGMSLEKASRFDTSSTTSTHYSSCPVFNPGDFTHPRPPENDKDALSDDTLSDMTTLTSDSANAFLLQMFMSELGDKGVGPGGHTHSPAPQMLKQQELSFEDEIASPTDSTSSLAKATTCVDPDSTRFASLECTDQTGLDDPFLMDFTDISQLLPDNPNVPSLSPSLYDRSNITSPCFTESPTSSNCNDVNELSFNPSTTTSTECNNTDLDFLTLSELVSSESSPLSTAHTSDYDFETSTHALNFSDDLDLEALGITVADHDQLSELLLSVAASQDHSTLQLEQSYVATSSSTCELTTHTPSPTSEEVASPMAAISNPNTTVVAETNDKPSTSRKRKQLHSTTSEDSEDSEDDDLSMPSKKGKTITKDDKYRQRRDKNNVASQVSRARRKNKRTGMFDRVAELETTNAELKRRVEEMTAEAESLRKMLVQRLAHT